MKAKVTISPAKKRGHPIGAAFLSLFFTAVFSLPAFASASLTDPAKIPVAEVNGASISLDDLNYLISLSIPKSGTMHDPVYRQSAIRDRALEQLIIKEILYQEAVKAGLTANPKLVNIAFIRLRERYGNLEAFRKARKASGMTEADVKKGVERVILIDMMAAKVLKEVPEVTEEEAKKEYESNLSKYSEPEQRRVRMIMVRVDPGRGQEGYEEGRDRIQAVYKLLQEGEDFSELAREVSDDKETAAQGGEMGFVHKGNLYPEVEKMLDTMKAGELSTVGYALQGFFVLKLEEVKPAAQLEFDRVKKRISTSLLTARKIEYWKNWVNEKKSQAKIVIFEQDTQDTQAPYSP